MATPASGRSVALSVACMMSFAAAATPGVQDEAGPREGPGVPGSIVFERSRLDAGGFPRSTNLFLATLDGRSVRAVTPAEDGVLDGPASWSPDGSRIAFQRGSLESPVRGRFDIYTLDRRTLKAHRLTHGKGSFLAPAWGPGDRIAYVSRYAGHDCLSVIDGAGRHGQDLFCPPAPTELSRPTWSADGASLYVAGGHDQGVIAPSWRALAYRVDATTGAATVLDDRVLDEQRLLEIAPDGRRGIYSDPYAANDMTLVDFARGTTREAGWGHAPRWSPDGRRIAFTGEVYESAPDFRYYEPLFVMRADGSGVRRVTRARVDNHAYIAIDWAKDNAHLLANRRIYLDPSLTIPSLAMRIVDVDTRTARAVAAGAAEPGAWLQR